MLLPLPQNCLQPSHKSDKERNRSVGRGGDGMRGRGEIKEWQRRVTEEDGGARKWKGGGAGGGLQWLVCLVRFVFSLSALLSIHPSCWDRKRWKCEDSSAGSSWEERWSAAPAGTTRSIAGGGELELVKIAWAELQAEFLMPHLLFIGSSGRSFAACQRSTYNQTSSIIGTPLWVLFWNSLILPGAMKVNFNRAQSQKIAFLLFRQ